MQVGEVVDGEVSRGSGRSFEAAERVDDADPGPVGATVGFSQPRSVELAAELGHRVFIDDLVRAQSELLLKKLIEGFLAQAVVGPFVTPGFHGPASGWQAEWGCFHSVEKVEEGEGGSQNCGWLSGVEQAVDAVDVG